MKSQFAYRLLGIFVLLYMFFVVGKVSYQNYKIDQKIKGLKNEVEALEEENKKLLQNIEYYKTDEYKEKVARQRFGLKKPDEKVMVIVPAKEPEKEAEKKPEPKNPEKWWRFFFGTKEN